MTSPMASHALPAGMARRQGEHAFCVAEHALLVEAIVTGLQPAIDPQWQLAALLHDAPEYVIGDLISPFKAAIGLDYKAFELRLLAAIHRRFGLSEQLPDEVAAQIKAADAIAAFFEATRLAGFAPDEAERFFGRPPPLPDLLQAALLGLSPGAAMQAQRAFLMRFHELVRVPDLQ